MYLQWLASVIDLHSSIVQHLAQPHVKEEIHDPDLSLTAKNSTKPTASVIPVIKALASLPSHSQGDEPMDTSNQSSNTEKLITNGNLSSASDSQQTIPNGPSSKDSLCSLLDDKNSAINGDYLKGRRYATRSRHDSTGSTGSAVAPKGAKVSLSSASQAKTADNYAESKPTNKQSKCDSSAAMDIECSSSSVSLSSKTGSSDTDTPTPVSSNQGMCPDIYHINIFSLIVHAHHITKITYTNR
jgi:hypothetical protein